MVPVPVGTVVHDSEGLLLADLAGPGDELVAAQGGRGGRGNVRFVSSTRRAPGFAERGEPGQEAWLRLELRLLADVGLIGWPNAGKSTLISRISSARPKIADYPFTTLVPNLGVVATPGASFVVADIPGLIPGAHEGKGLGHRFLRHVGRAALFVFVIDLAAPDRDPGRDVETLKAELEAFDPELAARPSIVVAAKADAGADRLEEVTRRIPEVLAISSVTGYNIDELVRRLGAAVAAARTEAPPAVGYVRHVVSAEPTKVAREGNAWRVTGRRPERAVAATDMCQAEAVVRLQRRLISLGVERALAEAGAQRGDDVRIGAVELSFEPEDERTSPSESGSGLEAKGGHGPG